MTPDQLSQTIVDALEALVAEHPLRERLQMALMTALYRSGRQAEALDAYREARRVLVEEVGIEPSRALQDLERAILQQSPALDADPGLLVCLNEDPSGANPHPRMTLTFSGIARARLALFTVTGSEKQAAMQAVYDGVDVPAARVVADRVVWLVDRDAAPRG